MPHVVRDNGSALRFLGFAVVYIILVALAGWVAWYLLAG